MQVLRCMMNLKTTKNGTPNLRGNVVGPILYINIIREGLSYVKRNLQPSHNNNIIDETEYYYYEVRQPYNQFTFGLQQMAPYVSFLDELPFFGLVHQPLKILR